jgi:histidyl-tRNA synthetase
VPRTQPVRAARGVRDILPSELAAWSLVESKAVEAARRFGYQQIETPIIEPVELIERGVGETTDAAGKELYLVAPRSESKASLALRPEATAGVVRAYFEGGLNQGPQPVRLFLTGPMFRHDRPQAGRYRQFYQFNVEVIGDGSAAYDAEVIELTWGWLLDLGLRGLSLELNSMGDEVCRPGYLERLRAYYRPLKDSLHGDCQRRLEQNPLRLFDCKEPQCQPFKERAPKIAEHLCPACDAAFHEVRELLEKARIPYQLNPYLARGLDYYTRTVFEYQHEALGGAQNSLGGGGRYDGLAETLGYPATPGMGFAAGLDRVVMMLAGEGEEVIPAPAATLLVMPDGEGLTAAAAELARLARAEEVGTAVDFSQRSLRAKMRGAGRAGHRWVALLDQEQAQRRVAQLRDMVSGEQQEVAWEDLASRLL